MAGWRVGIPAPSARVLPPLPRTRRPCIGIPAPNAHMPRPLSGLRPPYGRDWTEFMSPQQETNRRRTQRRWHLRCARPPCTAGRGDRLTAPRPAALVLRMPARRRGESRRLGIGAAAFLCHTPESLSGFGQSPAGGPRRSSSIERLQERLVLAIQHGVQVT